MNPPAQSAFSVQLAASVLEQVGQQEYAGVVEYFGAARVSALLGGHRPDVPKMTSAETLRALTSGDRDELVRAAKAAQAAAMEAVAKSPPETWEAATHTLCNGEAVNHRTDAPATKHSEGGARCKREDFYDATHVELYLRDKDGSERRIDDEDLPGLSDHQLHNNVVRQGVASEAGTSSPLRDPAVAAMVAARRCIIWALWLDSIAAGNEALRARVVFLLRFTAGGVQLEPFPISLTGCSSVEERAALLRCFNVDEESAEWEAAMLPDAEAFYFTWQVDEIPLPS